jgi:hypothetical protein
MITHKTSHATIMISARRARTQVEARGADCLIPSRPPALTVKMRNGTYFLTALLLASVGMLVLLIDMSHSDKSRLVQIMDPSQLTVGNVAKDSLRIFEKSTAVESSKTDSHPTNDNDGPRSMNGKSLPLSDQVNQEQVVHLLA